MRENEYKLNTFNDDIYNRKVIAENLIKIIDSQEESMVMSLDSAWGTGKTTFITMWKDMLDSNTDYNTKFKTLYFNAWENDYIKEPLLALFSEIQVQLKEEDSKLKQSFDKVMDKLKPIAKLGITTGTKLITAGVLDLDKIKLGDYNEKQLIDLAGKLGELSVQEISASKSIRRNFREAMVEYQVKSEKKIIFFIDELDRCRPTFAIELLEVIKHLFNLDNCIFVISIDKEQLSHSVSTIYGYNMDTVGYLRRFFDLDYKLPNIDRKKYVDKLNSEIVDKYNNIALFKFFIKEQFEIERFSLRDIDKAYNYIKLLLPLIKQFNSKGSRDSVTWSKTCILTISYIYSILITTKIKKPILYNNIINFDYNTEELISNFKLIPIIQNTSKIGGWSITNIPNVIEPILKMYFGLAMEIHKENRAQYLNEDDYLVGLKQNDKILDGWEFSILWLFTNEELSIIRKMEFIESFSDQNIKGSE